MSDKKLYQEKLQAQLDGWKADIDKLKSKAAEASADAKIELQKQIDGLEGRLEEGKVKLAELSDASHEAWESLKEGAESVWASIKTSFHDAKDKFKG
ncbi:MAG: coiled coil domain-containing protein [Pseudomonadota bacterium]|nr:coiled coil domain-containing protein [Pseudomonadota bacterium]